MLAFKKVVYNQKPLIFCEHSLNIKFPVTYLNISKVNNLSIFIYPC